MAGSYREISVRLHRDAFNTPWGFRLQGGKDFNSPLAVQRVFVGSPAESELQRGDILLNIDNYDCRNMMHKQAMDIIKNSGGSLSVTLKRGPRSGASLPSLRPTSPPKAVAPDPNVYRTSSLGQQGPVGTLGFIPKPTRPAMSVQPKVQTFGVDYSKYGQKPAQPARQQYGTTQGGPTYPKSMLNRLNASLNDAIWMPGQNPTQHDLTSAGHDTYQDYREPATHAPSHASFGGSSQPSSVPVGGRIWSRPDPHATGGIMMPEPGWTAGMGTQSTNAMARGWAPVKPPQPPLYMAQRPVPVPINARKPQPREIRHYEPEEPAWKGSLRGSNAPQAWEVQAAALQIDPEYAQHAHGGGGGGEMVQPHQPRVQNVHYQPGHAPVYSQATPVAQPPAAGDSEEGAKVVHLQYNSPLQLYSRDNVDETLRGQTGGGPGDGSMQVSGGRHIGPDGKPADIDFTKSETYRLIQQEEARARARPPAAHPQQHQQQQHHQQQQQQHHQQPPAQSARYMEQAGPEMHYEGYQDHYKQSPSMHALEAHVGDMSLNEPEGCSDF